MEILLREINKRNNWMVSVSRFFLQKQVAWNNNISSSVSESFAVVINEGFRIGYCIRRFRKVFRLTTQFKERIEAYLELCEYAITVLGEELLDEFCELMNVLEYLRLQRQLLIRHMNELMNR